MPTRRPRPEDLARAAAIATWLTAAPAFVALGLASWSVGCGLVMVGGIWIPLVAQPVATLAAWLCAAGALVGAGGLTPGLRRAARLGATCAGLLTLPPLLPFALLGSLKLGHWPWEPGEATAGLVRLVMVGAAVECVLALGLVVCLAGLGRGLARQPR